jgi:hypothetical protein
MRSSEDRQRYITMGALMFLTTAQAFYCGASVAAMALSRPFFHVAGYGLFLAGSVFFIDRSIVSYIAPRQPGDDRSRKPRHSHWAIGLRIILATAASVLLAEVLLLQIFAHRINLELVSYNATAQRAVTSQIDRAYQPQFAFLHDQIDAAQVNVDKLQNQLNAVEHQARCELHGCQGNPPSAGALYRADLTQVHRIERSLSSAEANLQKTTNTNSAKSNALEQDRAAAVTQAMSAANASQDMLAREQAFWALTTGNPEIAYARILLMLLLLSIDLAPVIVKITSSYGAYEEDVRSEMLAAQLRTEANAELLEERIRIDAEVRRARQELDRDIALAMLEAQRRQHGNPTSDRPKP